MEAGVFVELGVEGDAELVALAGGDDAKMCIRDRADSSLATAEVVSLADLANEQFILLERGSDDEITPLFRRAGLAVRSKLSTWDDYAIMAMVEDGLGVSILPALILRRCQFDVAVRSLEGHPHRQKMCIRDRVDDGRAFRTL